MEENKNPLDKTTGSDDPDLVQHHHQSGNAHFPEDSQSPAKIEIKPVEPATNAEQPPTDMEVHHHAHSHGVKNWKAYFWEFLMLFLAVFCGFLAEYYLEHKIEKERGKQYIESFYEDLKADTFRITDHTRFDDAKINALGHLDECYQAILKDMKGNPCLFALVKATAINRPFKMTERTLSQLSAAGGFRLLSKEDADSIIAYQKEYNNFQDFQVTVFQETQDNVRSTFNLLMNFEANVQMFKANGTLISTFDEQDVTKPLLFSPDKDLLNKYFNELLLYYRVTYNHRLTMARLKQTQTRLILYLKNKYQFQ